MINLLASVDIWNERFDQSTNHVITFIDWATLLTLKVMIIIIIYKILKAKVVSARQ